MRVRAYGIIKSHCVLLCMLWVIGSIVFVDTHQNHPARGCGFRARDRAVFGIIALRSIVDSVEYHDCNQSHALRRISKYTKQFVWICFSFLFFSFFLYFFYFFFVFFFLRSRRLWRHCVHWWNWKMLTVNSKQRWIFISRVYMSVCIQYVNEPFSPIHVE